MTLASASASKSTLGFGVHRPHAPNLLRHFSLFWFGRSSASYLFRIPFVEGFVMIADEVFMSMVRHFALVMPIVASPWGRRQFAVGCCLSSPSHPPVGVRFVSGSAYIWQSLDGRHRETVSIRYARRQMKTKTLENHANPNWTEGVCNRHALPICSPDVV